MGELTTRRDAIGGRKTHLQHYEGTLDVRDSERLRNWLVATATARLCAVSVHARRLKVGLLTTTHAYLSSEVFAARSARPGGRSRCGSQRMRSLMMIVYVPVR